MRELPSEPLQVATSSNLPAEQDASQVVVDGSPEVAPVRVARGTVPDDVREAFIEATVAALLLDLQESPLMPCATDGSPSGHKRGVNPDGSTVGKSR